jgi:hypothetical protein
MGSSNMSTPVIIIRLVGRSMRSQAVSTLDMDSRRGRLSSPPWPVLPADFSSVMRLSPSCRERINARSAAVNA